MGIITWILTHRKSLKIAVFIASVGFLSLLCSSLYKQNKSLSESLKIAETNVLAYLGLLNDSLLANHVLRLDVEQLLNSNDSLVLKLDEVREQLNIKKKELNLAATKTQTVNVTSGKKTNNVIVKDSIYNDSILYNDLTKIYYTIGKDTISMTLDIKNTEYFYVFNQRLYKNKKNFLRRLFTWDWKKINILDYHIVNTNELFNLQDVRVVEIQK